MLVGIDVVLLSKSSSLFAEGVCSLHVYMHYRVFCACKHIYISDYNVYPWVSICVHVCVYVCLHMGFVQTQSV